MNAFLKRLNKLATEEAESDVDYNFPYAPEPIVRAKVLLRRDEILADIANEVYKLIEPEEPDDY